MHEEYYSQPDSDFKRDVKEILGKRKRAVLKGCVIAFTGLIPLEQEPRNSDIWRLAESFGAQCLSVLDETVTHLIAARSGTEKVNRAIKLNASIVKVDWYIALSLGFFLLYIILKRQTKTISYFLCSLSRYPSH